MNNKSSNSGAEKSNVGCNFEDLYDQHDEYKARRVHGSHEQRRIDIEVNNFKVPQLVNLLPNDYIPESILEIGCATGELLAAFPLKKGGTRCGIDISSENIRAARGRFSDAIFISGDFRNINIPYSNCVIMSDILEHVEDDEDFLRAASECGRYVLVNLPLEKNWLNIGRKYGPLDASGHLRNYDINQGLKLFDRAGLNIISYRQVWVHETNTDQLRRDLRKKDFGSGYSGNFILRVIKAIVVSVSIAIRPLGRRLFASNLFALAERRAD